MNIIFRIEISPFYYNSLIENCKVFFQNCKNFVTFAEVLNDLHNRRHTRGFLAF